MEYIYKYYCKAICYFGCASLLMLSSIAHTEEWGNEKEITKYQREVDIKLNSKMLKVIWNNTVVPGSTLVEIFTTYSKYNDIKFLTIYEYLGNINGSMRIKITVTELRKNTSSTSPGYKEIYLEKFKNDSYYLVPEDMKSIGYFQITKDLANPGQYILKLVKN